VDRQAGRQTGQLDWQAECQADRQDDRRPDKQEFYNNIFKIQSAIDNRKFINFFLIRFPMIRPAGKI
jgi:hypothetical protein